MPKAVYFLSTAKIPFLSMRLTTITYLSILSLHSTPTFAYAFENSLKEARSRVWTRSTQSTRNVPPQGFYNPMAAGGSMLTSVPGTFPAGQGEPINAIISGLSDERVLQDEETNGGLRNYFLSFGFSAECLGQHAGSDQLANLGDGNGYLNETGVIRWNYGDAQLGACKETIQGGNHFRYWIQNGPNANSGSIFMAVSYEEPIAQSHDIVRNGYNLGRDWLIGNITGSPVPTPNVTNATSFSSSTTFANYTYHTDIQYLSGLLQDTNIGINHNLTVGTNGVNATDGLVAFLNVTITRVPPKSGFAWRPSPPYLWQLPPLLIIFVPTLFSSIYY